MKNLLALAPILIPFFLLGNDVQLGRLLQVSDRLIHLEVSWSHSWNFSSDSSSGSQDALWVFFKYRDAQGIWQPLYLSSTDVDHQSDNLDLTILASMDGLGVWVKRTQAGAGDIPTSNLQLSLAHPLSPDAKAISAFAIEMVDIPTGAYWLGDGQSFHHFREAGTDAPIQISSEAELDSNRLSAGEENSLEDALPEAYPKGYHGFLLMKHELSQEAYRDFLNSLTYEQQVARTESPPNSPAGTYALAPALGSSSRSGLVIAKPGIAGQRPAEYALDANTDGLLNQMDDGHSRACNYLSWSDLLAYLDWAGLRPITELEYEKACRGPLQPIPGEFAWGTAQVVDANTVIEDGYPTEGVMEKATGTVGLASHGYQGPSGPLRAGFGGSDSSNRLQIGGGYYGCTELSGNLWELCVGVRLQSTSFDGQSGDGRINDQGEADVSTWPGAAGAIYRGGAHNSGIFGPYRDLAVSDRFYHDLPPNQRRNTSGGRGGRSY